MPTNTHFEADQFARGPKIANRSIICQKRLTPGNCRNHHYGNRWGMLKSMKFTFNVQVFFLLPLCLCPWKLFLFHLGRRNILNSLSGKIRQKTKKIWSLFFFCLSVESSTPPPPPPQKKRKEKASKVTMIIHFFKVMPIMDRSAFCACPKQSEWTSSYNHLFVLHTLCLLKVKNGTIVAMEYTLCLHVSVFAYFATLTSCNAASAHLH